MEAALTNACEYHNDTQRGILLVAAHLICLSNIAQSSSPKPDGGMGVVKREKIGQQEVEYETSAGGKTNKVWWSTTPYGREFLQLEARNPRQVMSVLVV